MPILKTTTAPTARPGGSAENHSPPLLLLKFIVPYIRQRFLGELRQYSGYGEKVRYGEVFWEGGIDAGSDVPFATIRVG